MGPQRRVLLQRCGPAPGHDRTRNSLLLKAEPAFLSKYVFCLSVGHYYGAGDQSGFTINIGK